MKPDCRASRTMGTSSGLITMAQTSQMPANVIARQPMRASEWVNGRAEVEVILVAFPRRQRMMQRVHTKTTPVKSKQYNR